MPIDITEDNVRIRQMNPSYFDPKSFRTITISEEKGIKAVVGCKRGSYISGRCKTGMRIQTYLFSKEKWTLEKAKAWIKSHKNGMTKKESDKEAEFRKELKTLQIEQKSLNDEFNKIYQDESKDVEEFDKETNINRQKIYDKRKPKKDSMNKRLEEIRHEIEILYNAIGEEMAED
jgi:hypothetical protein